MDRYRSLFGAVALAGLVACNKSKPAAQKNTEPAPPTTVSSRVEPVKIPGLVLDPAFEGEVTLEVAEKDDKESKTFIVEIKSPKVRADLGAFSRKNDPLHSAGASMIFDPPAKKGYIVVPAKKTAMIIDLEKVKRQRTAPAPSAGRHSVIVGGPKIEKTGTTEIVAGYGCEIWKLTSTDASRVVLCMAEGLKLATFPSVVGGSQEFASMTELDDVNWFPLRAVAFDKTGVQKSRMEVKKVEKKALPDEDFAVPADYQRVDMSQATAPSQLKKP